MLTPAQIQRYVRQLLLPQIGLGGQEKLAAARFELPGSELAVMTVREYLKRAGVGESSASPDGSGELRYALNNRGFAWSKGTAPCEACLEEWVASLPLPPPLEQPAVAMAAGALAASQLMLAPLDKLESLAPGRATGFAFWPAVLRQEIRPREACGCGVVAGG